MTEAHLQAHDVLRDRYWGLIPDLARAFGGERLLLPPLHVPPESVPSVRGRRAHWVRPFIYPVKGETGTVLQVIIMFSDITAQKEAEEQLEQRVEQRTRELSTLLELSSDMASTVGLAPLLELILERLEPVVDYDRINIFMLEGEQLRNVGHRGCVPCEMTAPLVFPVAQLGEFWTAMLRREPLIVGDAQAQEAASPVQLAPVLDGVRAWMGVPLAVKERVIGALLIAHVQPEVYTPRHAALALAVANQAAVAIENARLYEQARRLAVLEERQRLARELHDSVSQALYGIGLGTRTAQALLARGPVPAPLQEALAEPLAYVLSLADAGLVEMRALIFELRPDSLEKEGLVAALSKQAAALRARHKLEVRTDFCPEPALPFEVKEALYRIAQEALNNVVKHAQASQVMLQLQDRKGEIVLQVRDDGVGFDPDDAYLGHLGLHSMRERAAQLGSTLEIKSAPGQGTVVTVRVRPASAGEQAR
jgi:signal transduction histidine kinase